MTEATKEQRFEQPQYRNTGFNQTVHDWVEKALKNITDASGSKNGNPCPAIWEGSVITSSIARGRLARTPSDTAAMEYTRRWSDLNRKYRFYGRAEDPSRNLTATEAQERTQVLMDFLFDVGALQMAEREQEWREERLMARDRMMNK